MRGASLSHFIEQVARMMVLTFGQQPKQFRISITESDEMGTAETGMGGVKPKIENIVSEIE